MEQNYKLSFTESNFNESARLVSKLKEKVSILLTENESLKEEIQSLKSQLNTDSHNSGKSPSTDGKKNVNIN